jgi:hypothetical protein
MLVEVAHPLFFSIQYPTEGSLEPETTIEPEPNCAPAYPGSGFVFLHRFHSHNL